MVRGGESGKRNGTVNVPLLLFMNKIVFTP